MKLSVKQEMDCKIEMIMVTTNNFYDTTKPYFIFAQQLDKLDNSRRVFSTPNERKSKSNLCL